MKRRSFLAALSAFLATPFALRRSRLYTYTPRLCSQPLTCDGKPLRANRDLPTDHVYQFKITYVTKDGREVDARWAQAHPQEMTARGIFYGAKPV